MTENRSMQAANHLAYGIGYCQNPVNSRRLDVTKPLRNQNLRFHLLERALRHPQVVAELRAHSSALTLGNVGWHRNGSTSKLSGQRIDFFFWKAPRHPVHLHNEFHRLLPCP
jgi:hypothetical protein